MKPPFAKDYPRAAFKQLQADATYVLKRLVDGRDWKSSKSGTKLIQICTGRVLVPVPAMKGRAFLHVTGALRDVFLEVLFHLLGSEESDRILRCPECSSLFYRVRRQKFCRPSCANRAFWRTYPSTAKGKRARLKQYRKHGWSLGGRTTKKK